MDDEEGQINLTASPGQEFHVELKTYPGSGAMWRCVSAEGAQLLDEKTRTLDESIGSPALQVFTLRADSPGSYNLVFELKRAWEPASRGRKEIRIDVK